MSVVQARAETEAAIQRARSGFASEPEPAGAATNAAGAVETATQSTATAGQTTSDMSGAFITTHKTFVDESAPKLSAAARIDTALQEHTAAAATLTEAGLILAGARDLNLDLAGSILIGDQPSDLAPARAAGSPGIECC